MAAAGAVLFVISCIFPLVASLSEAKSIPVWVGFLDVGTAFVLVLLMIVIEALAKGSSTDQVRRTSYRAWRVVINLPLVLLVIFFAAGDHIRWQVLLPGLAWRAWVSLYVLPAWLVAWRSWERPGNQAGSATTAKPE